MKKKILIIGATTGLGNLVRKALEKDFNVYFTSKKINNYTKLIFDLNKKYTTKEFQSIFKDKYDLVILNAFTKVKRISIKKIKNTDIVDLYNKNFFSYVGLIIFLIQKRYVKNFLLINSKAVKTGGYNISHYTSLKMALATFLKHATQHLRYVNFYDIKFGPISEKKNKVRGISFNLAAKQVVMFVRKKILK